MPLIKELKSRNVFRVAIAYLAASWLIVQVIETIFPIFSLSDGLIRIIVIILLIGFPVTLVLSWFFEITPQGLMLESDVDRSSSAARPSYKRFDRGIIVVLIVALGYFALDKFVLAPQRDEVLAQQIRSEGFIARAQEHSIAVLPFVNFSDDKEQEYFADGLTEELLNSLATINGLRVTSRTSSFVFKDSPLRATEVAAKLGVAFILEGSVRRTGNMIRITAQLIDAESDSHLWSRTYEDIVGADNLFRVQENIAALVADSLKVRLAPENAPKAPASVATLDLYYDGLFIFNELKNGRDISDENFNKAASKFEAAIKAEPEWLPAFVKLGQLYHWWSFGGSDREKLETSRRYITEALRRDPQNAAANWSMGYILWAEGDFEASLNAYETAEKMGGVQGWGRAITLASLGRFDDALATYREAVPIYPVSLALQIQVTWTMYCAGQYLSIVNEEEDLIANWPEGTATVKYWLAKSYARLGNREKALTYVEDLAKRLQTEAYFAQVFAVLEERERARRAIDELLERDQGLVSAVTATLILGDQDSALDILERHLEKQASIGETSFFFCEPEIRALAGNPRYDALLKSRGLLPD